MIEYCAVIWTEQESLSCDVNMSRSHCFNINNNARNDIDSVIRASKKCLCCCLSVKWLSHKRNSCASSIYENRQPIDCNTQISSALTFRRIVVALESVRDLTNKFSFNLNLKQYCAVLAHVFIISLKIFSSSQAIQLIFIYLFFLCFVDYWFRIIAAGRDRLSLFNLIYCCSEVQLTILILIFWIECNVLSCCLFQTH